MRLKITHARQPNHKDVVCGVAWANSDEMLSAGDDHKLLKWNTVSMEASTVTDLPSTFFPTSMHWFPRTAKGSNDVFAMTSTDGKLHFITKLGKIEKSVDAHKGAALSCRWSGDGTGLLTCGEDGAVKMWSRNGMLRSVLAQLASPVYCASWDTTSSRVLYCNGDSCYLKSLKSQIAALKWKAHDGLVLCCAWSDDDVIVTGGEDCKFKVWDSFGRVLFTSSPHDFPITSVSWSPDSQLFAVGSFNILRLCDKAGWSHSLEKLSTGSVYSISWSPDGTQLSAGCAGGHVVHAHLIEKRLTYRHWEVVQTKPNIIEVRDVSSDVSKEKLETRDRVTRISVNFEQLIVVTTSQIYVFSSKNWNTPVIIELKEKAPSLIIQCEKIFLLLDGAGLYVFNYEGRHVCELKVPGGSAAISDSSISLSNDTVAVRDRIDQRLIHILDPTTSKPQGDGNIQHEAEIVEVALNQVGSINDRLIAFRDRNSNVYVGMIKTFGLAQRVAKIGSLVEQLRFNDVTNQLAGVADGRIVVWPDPSVVFVDRSLMNQAVMEKPINGPKKFPSMLHFTGDVIILRRSDGSLLPIALPPFAAVLLSHISKTKWDNAIRLCRLAKNDCLWAVLAGLATKAKNLYAAEIAFGALDEIEKVQILAESRKESNKDTRTALLLMLAGKISEADQQLERCGQTYKALMLNVKMFRWDRALDIALKHKKYLEIAIGYRQRYLKEMNREESNPRFLKHMNEVEIDWDHIRDLMRDEESKNK